MILADSSKIIQCDVCNFEVDESDWDAHIDTVTHKKGALSQIVQDSIGSADYAGVDLDARDETAEFLEELKQDFAKGKP